MHCPDLGPRPGFFNCLVKEAAYEDETKRARNQVNVTVLHDTCQVLVRPLLCRLLGIYYLCEELYFWVPVAGPDHGRGRKIYLLTVEMYC
jgi:hypothetical protein